MLGPSVRSARARYVGPGAIVTVNVRVGRFATINTHCLAAHDDVLGDFVTLHPDVHLSGEGRGRRRRRARRRGDRDPRRDASAPWAVLGAGCVAVRALAGDRHVRRRTGARFAGATSHRGTFGMRRKDHAMSNDASRCASPTSPTAERAAVLEVLATPTLALGPRLERFERGSRRASARRTASASAAGPPGCISCMIAAGVEEGDVVLTTPFSFVASANCILYERARPVFVDIDPRHAHASIRRARRDRVDARAARAASASEGACCRCTSSGSRPTWTRSSTSPGATAWRSSRTPAKRSARPTRDAPVGTLGDAGVFAFYPNKQMTTGEGGMIVTDDAALGRAVPEPPQPGPRRVRRLARRTRGSATTTASTS